jgi:hypothetical protein
LIWLLISEFDEPTLTSLSLYYNALTSWASPSNSSFLTFICSSRILSSSYVVS